MILHTKNQKHSARKADPLGVPRRWARVVGAFSSFGSRFGIVIAWLLVVVVFSILRPATYFSTGNFQTIFGSQSVLLILTLGLLLSLIVAEFDLSFGGVMSVALVLTGYLNVIHHWPIGLVVVTVLGFGILVGAINALFVLGMGLDSIVVTLGTGTALTGTAIGINNVTTAGISDDLVNAVRTQVFGLPLSFYYGLLLTVVAWYIFAYTPLGRYLYFVGASRDVARLSGLPVTALRAGGLVATSFMSAVAGVVLAGTLGAADPNISAAYLLPTFAAAFLGSTAVTPGRFNPWGSFIAVYFLISGITGLELLGLSGWIEDVFYGVSLVIAVTLSRLSAQHQARTALSRGGRP